MYFISFNDSEKRTASEWTDLVSLDAEVIRGNQPRNQNLRGTFAPTANRGPLSHLANPAYEAHYWIRTWK